MLLTGNPLLPSPFPHSWVPQISFLSYSEFSAVSLTQTFHEHESHDKINSKNASDATRPGGLLTSPKRLALNSLQLSHLHRPLAPAETSPAPGCSAQEIFPNSSPVFNSNCQSRAKATHKKPSLPDEFPQNTSDAIQDLISGRSGNKVLGLLKFSRRELLVPWP